MWVGGGGGRGGGRLGGGEFSATPWSLNFPQQIQLFMSICKSAE